MSTLNLAYDDSRISYGGGSTLNSTFNWNGAVMIGGERRMRVSGVNSISVLNGDVDISYSTDGGATFSTWTNPGGHFNTATLNMPNEGQHDVVIRFGFSMETTAGFTFTGSAPVVSAFPGQGSVYVMTVASLPTAVRLEPLGSVAEFTYGGPLHGYAYINPMVSARFFAKERVMVWDSGSVTYIVSVGGINGVGATDTTVTTASGQGWKEVHANVGSTYTEVILWNMSGGTVFVQVAADDIQSSTVSLRDVLAAYGDSNIAGTGTSTVTNTVHWQFARSHGYSIAAMGIGFTTVAVAPNAGSAPFWDYAVTTAAGNYIDRKSGLTACDPKYIVIYYGVNDYADQWYTANTANGHESAAEFRAQYAQMLEYFRDNCPSLLNCFAFSLTMGDGSGTGIMPTPTAGTYNAALVQAHADVADSRFVLISGEPIRALTTDIHWGDTGHAEALVLLDAAFIPPVIPPTPSTARNSLALNLLLSIP